MDESKKVYIDSIKSLLDRGMEESKAIELCERIYGITDFINEDYPKHKSWFYKKQMPETLDREGNRDIIFALDGDGALLGTAFVKNDEMEKKICTLYVDENARGMGVGTSLVEKSMEILGTTKPMITLADYKLPMFEGLIEKYGWEQTQCIEGAYNAHSAELVFNGYLEQ